jgi:2-keto-4-pentenoate hydratase/2-oxohepta-3-ene-1,7-dioic acid hydratase in catechol pathway
MKLARYGDLGQEKPAVLTKNGDLIDVSAFTSDFDPDFFEQDGMHNLKQWLSEHEQSCPKVSPDQRLAAPLSQVSKIICVGLNYSKHASESGMTLPKEPVLFFKASSAICGPNDQITIPKNATKLDWEVELGVVIGKKATYVSKADAFSHIAGYVLHNDYSERAFQLEREGQWVKGKSHDTFAPLGPYLVGRDEIADPHKLDLWLKVNGERVQDSNTSDLVFKIDELVSYISSFMTLLPGDIISTGTPSGVGLGFDPPRYLKAGDLVELGIEGLGEARQEIINYPE